MQALRAPIHDFCIEHTTIRFYLVLPSANAHSSYGTFFQLHLSCVLLVVPSMVWIERALPNMPQVRYSQALADDRIHLAAV